MYNCFADADIAVIAVGEGRHLTGEARSVAMIELMKYQVDFAKFAKSQGKKVVAVVFAGRPLAITDIMPFCDAVLWA